MKVKLNKSLLDAIANECYDARLGAETFEKAVSRILETLQGKRTIIRRLGGKSSIASLEIVESEV